MRKKKLKEKPLGNRGKIRYKLRDPLTFPRKIKTKYDLT